MMRHASNQPCAAREIEEAERRSSWPPFPRMFEEDSGSRFGPRMRRVPDNRELAERSRIAIALGIAGAV
ncbi:hypothetical protein [Belnapia sp. F-4-1]|uniref:hypothetical protein n=1 Tax=Belnapia sp. F-4-1 TaxID=1545443 RepID=UPI0005B893CE|nr:hypothetical protein [Belnapia sp. F-4-1]